VETLNKAYAGKGISFYYVLSREPHPGFYGFTQTDSLEMRQEYVRLANAELQLTLPWIIDNMENAMQKAYGRMPNSEFIIGSDGTLLESRNWANPDKLKEWLEKNICPSGISDEEWEELGKSDKTMMAIGNNDEVPATEVPRSALFTLEVKRLDAGEDLPFSFEVGTLPPKITTEGQSRLYLTVKPDAKKGVSFDKSESILVDFSDVKGVKFIKDQLKSGCRRSSKDEDIDIYPHTLGVLWSLESSNAEIAFKATVTALVKAGEEEPKKVTAEFQVSGVIPEPQSITDEISLKQIPQSSQLKLLQCTGKGEEDVPMSVKAKIVRDSDNPNQGTIYLFLQVDKTTGHKWNNLSAPPQVALKPTSGVALEKNILNAAQHGGQDDADDRILAIRFNLEPGAQEFAFEATPEAWICNDDLGWCRLFTKTYRITGKF